MESVRTSRGGDASRLFLWRPSLADAYAAPPELSGNDADPYVTDPLEIMTRWALHAARCAADRAYYRPQRVQSRSFGRSWTMVFSLLTKRQAEYLRLACAGHTEQEIAARMGTGVSSVRGLRYGVLTRVPAPSIAAVCRMVDADETPPVILRCHRVRSQ